MVLLRILLSILWVLGYVLFNPIASCLLVYVLLWDYYSALSVVHVSVLVWQGGRVGRRDRMYVLERMLDWQLGDSNLCINCCFGWLVWCLLRFSHSPTVLHLGERRPTYSCFSLSSLGWLGSTYCWSMKRSGGDALCRNKYYSYKTRNKLPYLCISFLMNKFV